VPSGNSWTPSCWQLGGSESGGSSAPISLAYPRLSLALAAAATAGAAASVAGFSLIRDVLLGVLFVLSTAWRISVLAVFARQTRTSPTTSPPLWVIFYAQTDK
jgi:hypothetical protein